jgi:hypothetical protein
MKLSNLHERRIRPKTDSKGRELDYIPGESCTWCKTRLEKGDDGKCNQCGKPYETGPYGKSK